MNAFAEIVLFVVVVLTLDVAVAQSDEICLPLRRGPERVNCICDLSEVRKLQEQVENLTGLYKLVNTVWEVTDACVIAAYTPGEDLLGNSIRTTKYFGHHQYFLLISFDS